MDESRSNLGESLTAELPCKAVWQCSDLQMDELVKQGVEYGILNTAKCMHHRDVGPREVGVQRCPKPVNPAPIGFCPAVTLAETLAAVGQLSTWSIHGQRWSSAASD